MRAGIYLSWLFMASIRNGFKKIRSEVPLASGALEADLRL